jgi:AcrR family transcriptional regulator
MLRKTKSAARPVRTVNPEAHQRDIIEVATQEFAEHGLAGARIDEIAAKTACSKRLIYYYFGDKEGLYLAVLEHVYRRVRSVEADMAFDQWPPTEAMRRMVGFRFDHHFQNRDFVRLVMIENIHNARFLARSPAIHALSAKAVDRVDAIYRRGVAEGEFRPGLQALDIHWQISAMSFYNVSNSATFSRLFDVRLDEAEVVARLRANVIETVLRFVAPT